MAKITLTDGSAYLEKLNRLEQNLSREVIGKAVYAGADVVTDEIRKQLESLPTDERYGTTSEPTRGPNSYQKQGLLRSLGVAPLRNDDGFQNVKVGFDGYNGLKTKRWPKGQPNQMVMRAVENGTSWMKKNHPIKKAVQQSKERAVAAMAETADEQIENIMKGQ